MPAGNFSPARVNAESVRKLLQQKSSPVWMSKMAPRRGLPSAARRLLYVSVWLSRSRSLCCSRLPLFLPLVLARFSSASWCSLVSGLAQGRGGGRCFCTRCRVHPPGWCRSGGSSCPPVALPRAPLPATGEGWSCTRSPSAAGRRPGLSSAGSPGPVLAPGLASGFLRPAQEKKKMK